MNWTQNKKFFNYIIKNKYSIRKDTNTNNILYISWKKLNIKCKYFLLFVVNENEEILWSCDNIFIDNKTQYLSDYVKTSVIENGINEKKFNEKILNLIKKKFESNTNIEYLNEKINLMWVITERLNNCKFYYVITEIIYL